MKREPLPGERHPISAAGPKMDKFIAESTHTVAKFVPASTLAGKGFLGLRALKRVALGKPYKPAG